MIARHFAAIGLLGLVSAAPGAMSEDALSRDAALGAAQLTPGAERQSPADYHFRNFVAGPADVGGHAVHRVCGELQEPGATRWRHFTADQGYGVRVEPFVDLDDVVVQGAAARCTAAVQAFRARRQPGEVASADDVAACSSAQALNEAAWQRARWRIAWTLQCDGKANPRLHSIQAPNPAKLGKAS